MEKGSIDDLVNEGHLVKQAGHLYERQKDGSHTPYVNAPYRLGGDILRYAVGSAVGGAAAGYLALPFLDKANKLPWYATLASKAVDHLLAYGGAASGAVAGLVVGAAIGVGANIYKRIRQRSQEKEILQRAGSKIATLVKKK